MKRFSSWLGIAAAAAAFGGCAPNTPPPSGRPAVPVAVATVARKDVPVDVRVVGTVEAYSTVAVRSQVSGELRTVHFSEGRDVRKGDPLFSIDSRQLESDLKRSEANLAKDLAMGRQTEANLARDTALLRNAEAEARRYEQLVKEGIVSRDEYEKFRTAAESLAATVRADQAAIDNSHEAVRADRAAIENAKLQLGYCSIESPIAGRTGVVMVHAGNLVKANDTALVNINQVAPLYVSFAVPEHVLTEVKRYMAVRKLPVLATAPGEEGRPARGELSFIDNTVDASTGTIRLKGTFPNVERSLWPGQFVNVVMTLTTQVGAVVAPSQAIQSGQAGTFVFVVRPDLTVESRPVVSSRTVGAYAVIDKGLQEGDRVVTDGQLRLVPGAKIEVKSALDAKTAPEAAQGAHP